MKLLTCLTIIALIAASQPARAAGADPTQSDHEFLEETLSVERRSLAADSPLYQRIAMTLPAIQVAELLVVEARYPADWAHGAGRHSVIDALAQAASKTDNLDAPEPPSNPAPLGTKIQDTLSCVDIRVGFDTYQGTRTYHWEYRNTRDATGDGKPNADPKWVLVSTEFTYYNETEAGMCLT